MKICLLPTGVSFSNDEFERELNALSLGKSEETRLRSIKNRRVANDSLYARIALKKVCNDKACGDLKKDENGKPYFDGGSPLFSISHTQGLATAAIAEKDEGRIGIDIEILRTDRSVNSIAARFFNSDELSEFKRLNGSFDAFYSIWTKKEARAKLFGDGLAAELTDKHRNDAEIYYYQYGITFGQTRAILCVATEHRANKIKFIESKDFEIYGLQN